MPTYQKLNEQHIARLTEIVGAERLSARAADLDLHARDQSFHEAHPPEVVLWPQTADEVSQVLRLANEACIPVTPWGVGTSLEGNPMAVCGGIMLDFGRMNRIVVVRPEDFQVDVQPGVTRVELNKALARYGLFFAPDPGANATLGGMIANNASGIKTVKYGATKDNVMRLQIVKADGEIIQTGTRARKDSSGYDLLHLFIGSEGTLGIITEATLKLVPVPATFSAMLASFESVAAAVQAVVDLMGAALEPSALEFLDTEAVRAVKADRGVGWVESPMLILEFNGTGDEQRLAEAVEICKGAGATQFEAVSGLEQRNRLWEVRHHTYESLVRRHPNQSQLIMDVAVPLSNYPRLVLFVDEVLAEHQLTGYKVGHAGDGNLHVNIVYDPASPAQWEVVEAANALIVLRAIELEGTATGEHGVGIGKRKFIPQQHGAALDVMRQIKTLLDPNWILNPGKIFL